MPPSRNVEPPPPLSAESLVPPALLPAVDAVARRELRGDDLAGEALAAAVAELSARYTRRGGAIGESVGARHALCARLRFFLPRDFAKVMPPLRELILASALPPRATLRVLDLGSGLGTTALGSAQLLTASGYAERIAVTAVDSDRAALELGSALAQELATGGLPLDWESRADPLERLERRAAPAGGYDLILLGFVLNELCEGLDGTGGVQRIAALLGTLSDQLSENGAIIVLEPALRAHGRRLHRVRAALLEQPRDAGPHVFAPCMHQGPCPMLERDRDWCHELLPLPLPDPLPGIARAAGLRGGGLSYSYLTLTRQPRSLASLAPADSPGAPYRTVSGPLRSKGKLELLLCDDGPLRRVRRLDRRLSDKNAALDDAGRGSILRVRNGQPSGSRLEVADDTSVEILQSPVAAE